jgi:hypothetical protein
MDPILVGGDGRSGTTLLSLMLDAHPRIMCGPEVHLRYVDELESTYWLARMSRVGLTPDEIRDRMKRWPHPPIKRFPDRCKFLQSICMEMMKSRGKHRWGFKMMRDIAILNFYEKVWPESKYLHIIRDGRDVAASNLCYDWGYNSVPEAAEDWGLQILKARTEAEKIPERYFELRYEDLVLDTESKAREICDWLEEPFDREMLTPYKEGRYSPFFSTPVDHPSTEQMKEGITTKHIGKYRQHLHQEQIEEFEAEAGFLLKDLGYM